MTTFQDATPMGQYDLGPYEAILLGDIEAEGSITYLWALQVAKADEPGIKLLFTAETSQMTGALMQELGFSGEDSPSHFLCYFTPDGTHHNLGKDQDWSDAGVFLSAALRKAAELLGVRLAPAWVWSTPGSASV